MNQRVIKISKIVAITLVSIVLLLAVAIGIIFQFVLTPEKITPKVVQAINKNLNAELSIDAIELTFFKTFPNFKLELKNGYILNHSDSLQDSTFSQNDTLIQFDYGVVSVNPIAFIGNSIEVNKFSFENPTINAHVSSEGEVNWDIVKDNEPKPVDSLSSTDTEQKDFNASINIEEISIFNGNLKFDDQYSDNYMTVEGFDMNVAAKYSEKEVLLKLISQSDNVIIRKKGNTYTDELTVLLNTDFYVNRSTKVIDLKNAKVGINDITFDAEGSLNPNREKKYIDVDLHLDLEVPTLNTLVDLVPEAVFDKTDNYEATGDVSIIADIKGIYKKGTIPAINAKFKINNGSISYKNQSNKIDLIEADIDAYISPEIHKGSHFNIKNFTLKGIGTEINIKGKGRNLFDNADLDITADGKLDLEALENSFPFKKSLNLEGAGEIHLTSSFNINDIRNQDYGKIQALGTLNMDKIVFHNQSDSILLHLEKADIHLEQDQNSNLLTEKTTKVIGGKILIQNLEFKDGKNSSGNLDVLDIKFATTPIKDSTKVAVVKAKLSIENGYFNFGDTLKAQLNYINAQINLEPAKTNNKIPKLTSVFQIDSAGIQSKGRFFAISKGFYDLSSTKVNNNWPIDGHISFNQLYAYTPTFPLLLKMPKTKFSFKPGIISLDHAKIEIGNSDIEATGKVYNIGDAFFDNKMVKGELSVTSNNLDINEFIQALNDGSIAKEKELAEVVEDDKDVTKKGASKEPKSFVVPENLDLSLNSHFKNVVYKNFNIKDVIGIITIRDQEIHLANLGMVTMAAKMATTVDYTSKQKGQAALNFDFKLYDIDLSRLTVLMPVLDSLLPMANSFEGKVNFRMKGATKVDNDLGMQAKSLNAIARIEGDNLVILNGETFDKIAKMLFFKNKEQNTIDKLQFAVVFEDEEILIFPSVVQVDRYQVAIGGQHNLDMSFNYHFSILKSPMPFKAGIDVSGTDDDIDYKITKAKYKYLFSNKERQQKKADSTLIRKKNSIISSLPF